jgi:hypothetical protein
MLRVIISSIIAVMAIFVGFFPHSHNCKVISILQLNKCPGWEFHLILGGILFCLAVFISQKGNFISASVDASNTVGALQIQ